MLEAPSCLRSLLCRSTIAVFISSVKYVLVLRWLRDRMRGVTSSATLLASLAIGLMVTSAIGGMLEADCDISAGQSPSSRPFVLSKAATRAVLHLYTLGLCLDKMSPPYATVSCKPTACGPRPQLSLDRIECLRCETAPEPANCWKRPRTITA